MQSKKVRMLDAGLNVLSTRWGRRGALVSLLVGMATVVAKYFSWFDFSSAGREEYRVIADWQSTPDSRGLIISISPHSTWEDLRGIGKRLHDKFHDVDNVAVMVFDDAAAARQIRRGSRYVDETRFQAALAHQQGMYLKSARRGKDDFTIYKPYPVVSEVIRFNESDLRKTTG